MSSPILVIRLSLGLALLMLAGCVSDPVRDGPSTTPAASGAQQVTLYYATNRAVVDDSAGYFGTERGRLSFGVAGVSIPPNHVIGSNERPSMFKFEWSPDERKHIALRDTTPMTQEEFLPLLSQAVAASPDGRLMLFVHGYNTPFEEAARRVAQFATDLKFSGPVLLFSWPSQGSLTGYTVDVNNAEWAQPHLTQTLALVLDQVRPRQLYLVAHSMGTRITVRAYNELVGDRWDLHQGVPRELVLVAPDIDADLFRDELAPRLVAAGVRVTLYASSGDRALMASKAVHGYPRAGDSGEGLVIVSGVETVDASGVSAAFLGHSYFAEERHIMEDLFALIQLGQRADNRFGLSPVDGPDGRYWTFRK
jgi:esterase/lipase superfamily enzyme